MSFGTMTSSIMTLSIVTLRLMVLLVTFSLNGTQQNDTHLDLCVIMLNVVFMLNECRGAILWSYSEIQEGFLLRTLACEKHASLFACSIGNKETCFANFVIGRTLSVVSRYCATGYFGFGHEIAHLYGAYHNIETQEMNTVFPTAYGYLVSPPSNSGYRTILA